MGNHDWYLASGSFCLRSQTVNDTIEYQKKVISDKNMLWLKELPLYLKKDNLFMVHGGWSDPLDEYLRDPSDEYFAKLEGKYFASGHTHLARIDHYGEKIYCNQGSVGQPRDGNNQASFATWDGRQFKIYRVSYDFNKVGELMEQAGFSGYYYERLSIGAPNNGWVKDNKIKNV